jgi:hypothetical protein
MLRFLAMTALAAVITAPIAASGEPQADRVLPHDTVRAVNICMAASHPATSDGKIPLRGSIEAVWYLLEGARKNPRRGSLAERLAAFPSSDDDADAQVSAAEAPQLTNLCQQRWHNSHRGAIEIMLPVGRYDRDAQCYSVISFVNGMVDSDRVIDEEGLGPQIKKKMTFYERRLSSSVLAEHGLNTVGEQDKFFADLLFDALDLGNINDLVDACLRTPG